MLEPKAPRPSPRRRACVLAGVGLLLLLPVAPALAGGDTPASAGDEALTNPVLGDPAAIERGRRIYRTKCIICHLKRGGRGPNLFATELTDEQFLETVINGREDTLMPAFGLRLSPDDVWDVEAFVKSRNSY